MAIILLILIGFLTGWFAAILMRTEDSRAIMQDIGIGIAGSLIVGLVASNFTILGGLRWTALLAALAGAALLLVGRYYYASVRARD